LTLFSWTYLLLGSINFLYFNSLGFGTLKEMDDQSYVTGSAGIELRLAGKSIIFERKFLPNFGQQGIAATWTDSYILSIISLPILILGLTDLQ